MTTETPEEHMRRLDALAVSRGHSTGRTRSQNLTRHQQELDDAAGVIRFGHGQPIADVSAPTDERAAFEAFEVSLHEKSHNRPLTDDEKKYVLRPANSILASEGSRYEACQARWEGWQARAAAPVSGPTLSAEPYAYVTTDEKMLAFADCIKPECRHDMTPLYKRAAPVSGQGASIDTPEFRELMRQAAVQAINGNDSYHKIVDEIIAFVDSLPRSEDSRAKVLTDAEDRARLNWLESQLDIGAITITLGAVSAGMNATFLAFGMDDGSCASSGPARNVRQAIDAARHITGQADKAEGASK